MIKSYKELREIDVKPYCQERDGYLYLNWAKCIDLLRENGAEKVYFEVIPNEKTGGSLYYTEPVFTDSKSNTNRCYETRIRVVVDDNEWIMQSPVMNGTNPVKDNSMNQLRVWNSICRSFVKCIAIHTGLGFDLWMKEEQPPFDRYMPKVQGPLASEAQKKTLRTLAKKHNINLDLFVSREGKTMDTITEIDAANMMLAFKNKYGDE